jgi:acetylornithine deacetylase
MLAAMNSLASKQLTAPLWFVVTADEEIGMAGARAVVEHSLMYREIVQSQARSIIGEPTGLQVVYAHKGGRSIRVTSHGRAAHSSTGLGVNANLAMIPFLQALYAIHGELETQPQWRDERFSPPTPTPNLLLCDPNTAMNITSALSQCTLYFRPMPGQDADGLVDRLRAIAMRSGLQFEVMFSGEPLFSDPNGLLIRDLLQLSGGDYPRTVAYGTDGAVFTELQNIAVWGPGDIAQAHTDDEWISLEQLERGTDLYRQAIQRWCC